MLRRHLHELMYTCIYIYFVLTPRHLDGLTRACADMSPVVRDLTAHIHGRPQILAAPSHYHFIAGEVSLVRQGEPSSGQAAEAGSSILPSSYIRTLCSSPIPTQHSPMSLLDSHWSSTRLQDNGDNFVLLTSTERYLLEGQGEKKCIYPSSIY